MRIEFPGFLDLQVNGFAGVDFNDPGLTDDGIRVAAERMRATGVTRFLPTLITSSLADFSRCARTLVAAGHPGIVGLHMEGPYLSPADGPRGAHPLAHLRPASRDDFARRQDAADGRILLVTLAPEVPGALDLIEHIVGMGIVVAIGHSEATPEQIRDAVRAGARLSTHLGNGCAGRLDRHPNLLWEQLAEDALAAGFIADGHHLPPATLKAMVRAKTPSRSILVTDAMAAAGCGPGEYLLGNQKVVLDADGRVRQPGCPWLAGSALAMDRAVSNTVRFTGLPLDEVLPMATTRPAEVLGLEPAGHVTAEWDPETMDLRIVELRSD